MFFMKWFLVSTALSVVLSGLAHAQETTETDTDVVTTEAEAGVPDASLLTQAEIETLVAPVALYPDTLLIQILVASTQPFEVIKADRFLLENSEVAPEDLKPQIEAEGWDPSVEVLAVGFPDVIGDMAQHIEWTEAMGDAMNAQSDDVMDAVQVLRLQAVNSGALVSGEEQTVEVDTEENIIVQPTDPEVVYVPQYDPAVVYQNSTTAGDVIAAAAITFGTVALIDAIFDDDDDWYGYWGCRNCGWGGGGIYPYPGGGVNIDVDGNVNIGNEIDLGDRDRDRDRDRENIDIGDRDRPGNGAWTPDSGKRDEARDKIASKRDPDGKTRVPVDKSATNSDQLRAKLSDRSGAADISRPSANRPGGDAGAQVRRPGGGSRDLPQVNRPSAKPANVKRDAVAKTGAKPSVNRPAATPTRTQRLWMPTANRSLAPITQVNGFKLEKRTWKPASPTATGSARSWST